ncbi:MAG: hypothetical protein R3E08_11700 [Thiotrichaceae bacterium]
MTTSDFPVIIKLMQQGRSIADPYPDHHTAVTLNDQAPWGISSGTLTVRYYKLLQSLPPVLVDGDNKLAIQSVGDTGATVDVVYTNWAEIAMNGS